MSTERNIVSFFTSRVKGILDEEAMSIATLSNYDCGMLEFQKKHHLKREIAYLVLTLNDNVAFASQLTKETRFDIVDLVYYDHFQRDDKNEWVSSLVDRSIEYNNVLHSSSKKTPLRIASCFLRNLVGQNSFIVGFQNQNKIGNLFHNYFLGTMSDFKVFITPSFHESKITERET